MSGNRNQHTEGIAGDAFHEMMLAEGETIEAGSFGGLRQFDRLPVGLARTSIDQRRKADGKFHSTDSLSVVDAVDDQHHIIGEGWVRTEDAGGSGQMAAYDRGWICQKRMTRSSGGGGRPERVEPPWRMRATNAGSVIGTTFTS